MSNWEKEEKILGIRIGRRGKPRLRQGGPKKPIDGDGDGFYSLRPGLPDETPMVSAVVELGEEAFEGATPADREVSAAVAVAKKIVEQVVAKYGFLESQEDQKAALLKAFPGLDSSSLVFFSEQRTSSVDKKNKRSICIGLLHMADQKPKAAKRIVSIKRISDGTAHGRCTGTINTNGQHKGIGLSFRSDRDFATLGPNEIGRLARNPNAPWCTVIALGMNKRSEYTSSELNNFFWINIAVHEFGHAMHFDAGLTDAGMEVGDFVPEELSIRGFAAAFHGNESPATLENVKRMVDFRLDNSPSRRLPSGRPLRSRNEQVYKELILMAQDISDLDTEARETQTERHRAAKRRLGEATIDLQLWDGVPEAKREEIRRQLGKASGYGNSGFTTNPIVQYPEGVAETIARREMTGGVFDETDGDTRAHLRYILTKQEKDPMNELSEEEEDLLGCTGYLSEDENGKPIPVPTPEKPSDFKLTGSNYERFYKTV